MSIKEELKKVGYKGKYGLQSLIYACGHEFCGVFLEKNELDVSGNKIVEKYYSVLEKDYKAVYFNGKTPTIAVAKLLLKLKGGIKTT